MNEDPTPSTFSLAGKVALVTGASRGIGRALAVGLADHGADVLVTARDADDLTETATQIRDRGRWARTYSLDVRDQPAIDEVVDRAVDDAGRLDILVNNAGVECVRPSVDVDPALWDDIVDTNLRGAFFCARAGHEALASSGGAVINLGSLTSGAGVPTAAAYSASKAGLLGVTRTLATEWAPLGIRVNAIGPGYFHTTLTDGFFQQSEWLESMLAKIPMGRFGQFEDLIGPTVFLAGDAARYITGQILYIDGGFMAAA